MYSLPPYAFLAQDFTTWLLFILTNIFTGFIMCGAFAHWLSSLFSDYDPEANKGNVLARMLEHKEAIISHLSWVSFVLGFTLLGLYVHNDVMQAFGTQKTNSN
jgi:photosystem I P700 chlorophyll a apoprotein A2